MNVITKVYLLGIIGLSLISCQVGKAQSTSESQFYVDSIYSKNLQEFRVHNIYLPKGFDKEKKYTIIYATDGSEIIESNFIKYTLDSLINNQIIKPTIYVESYSNTKIADSTSTTLGTGEKVYIQYRNFEYVDREITRIEDSLLVKRFKNHMLYFKNELISKIELEFNQNLNKSNRIFYGFSNGAGFGANFLNKYPDIIGTYICFSTLGSDVQENKWKEDTKYPDLYLQYGSQESIVFQMEAENLKAKLDELNSFCELKKFNGGHNYKNWNEGFTNTISKVLKFE